jgi:S1-C subfamily serine protease/rhodanese-related sulfurtransferase
MRVRSVLLLAVLLTLPGRVAAQELTLQEMVLRAKPAVAVVVAEVGGEVTLRCGKTDKTITPAPYRESATGFLVSPRGWVITNAHVVFVAHDPPRNWMTAHLVEKAFRAECLPALLSARGLAPGERPELEDSLARAAVAATPADRVSLAPSVSIVLQNGIRLQAKIAKYSPPAAGEAMSGRDLALLRVGAADMPALPLGDSAGLKIGDKLSVIGFPGVVMSHELLSASSKVQASVTHGAVSGFKQDRAGQPIVQTDAAAEAGTSGGPVVDTAGRVVGVMTSVTQGEGGTVQGFNFVIPVASVKEFLGDTSVALDETSRFNTAWYAGLAEFFAGRYSRATRHLTEANRLFPELPDLQRIAMENAELVKTQPLLPWGRVGGGLVIASLAGYGLLLGRRWRRTRFRISPSEVARLLEGNEPPVIFDVREPLAYERSPVRIPRSLRVTVQDLAAGGKRPDVDQTRMIIAYCTCPDELSSARVAHELAALGYARVRILKGGLDSWVNAGLPLEAKA